MNADDETKRPLVDGKAELPAEPHASSSIMGRKRSSCPSNGAPHHVTFNIDSPPRVASYSSMSNVSTATDVVVPAFVHDSNFTQVNLVELYDFNLSDPKNVDGIWCETARWIKYEEDVEGVEKHRWGRPHVPLLSFHALNLLPKMIQNGIVMLNSKARNYVGGV
ncbi:Band-3-cyto domain-containing protein [Aphelenchoides fujianensis]|nr:Band-3-cyto domain-containing protein [Aphelenchoides fujianensis]